MNKSKLARWTIVGGLVGAAALAGALALALPAQAANLSDGVRSFARHGFGGIVDWWALLAEELGISVEELEQAVDAANLAAIDQLVDEGVLTEDEGELARAANALRSYLDHAAIVAEAMGISPEALQAALEDGSTLAELIEEQGMDRASYLENLQAARQAAIAEAVEDGVITQEQAEQLQETGRFPRFGPGHGPGFGPGGFGPRFGPSFGQGRGSGRLFGNRIES